MRCPICDRSADPGVTDCPAGHPLSDESGVIRLLPADLSAQVAALESCVAIWRADQGRSPLPRAALRHLPEGDAVAGDPEWRLRRADLALVRRQLAGRASAAHGKRLRILDIGAWNGWLSARLAADGHAATALDLFAGPDALGARHHLPGAWRAVQADPMDPAALGERFDVVILDRCLAFQPDPVAAVSAAAGVLDPGGLLIVTGIVVHADTELAALRLEAERVAFKARFGMDLLLRPSRGVLTGGHLAALRAVGLTVRDHPFLRIANIRAHVDVSRPVHRIGTLEVAP